MKKETKYLVPSVLSAARILNYLSRYRHTHATLTEIATALEISRATCLRILHTLAGEHLLKYDEDSKKYSLGPLLVVLGSRAAAQINYIAVAQKYLKKAAEISSFTCVLVHVIDKYFITYIAKEEVHDPMGVSVAVGQTFPITAGAHGKCFLAFMPEEESRQIIRQVGLRPYTQSSLTREDLYIEELKNVRAKGYATSIEEHYAGINGVSVPIFGYRGNMILAMSAIGMATSLTGKALTDCGKVLTDLAAQASCEISGYSSQSTTILDHGFVGIFQE